MLDAFIIERIRKEREQRERSPVPLRIEREPPRQPAPPARDRRAPRDEDERGSAIIDFTI